MVHDIGIGDLLYFQKCSSLKYTLNCLFISQEAFLGNVLDYSVTYEREIASRLEYHPNGLFSCESSWREIYQ